jgi:class 3 adenylate cyclase
VTTTTPASLRPWHRLGVRLSVLFALATLVAVGLVGGYVWDRQRQLVEESVAIQLLNVARTSVLLVDPALQAAVQREPGGEAAKRLRATLTTIRTEAVLSTPVYTLADIDPAAGRARRVASSDEAAPTGEMVTLAPEVLEPLAWTLADGFARATPVYRTAGGTWITAFAPLVDRAAGTTLGVLVVDYPVETYMHRLDEVRAVVIQGALLGALGALVLGVLVARRLTRPLAALTGGVARVAGGDLTQALPVRSRDEIGVLTEAFNQMLEGLRQRDFIRTTFGRYVSPEVVETLLTSPQGLSFGGEKRLVTILMSDLRGYTRFAEQGDPAWVMEVLNGYLARMTDIVVEHGGTINEFIGDAIFAIFGAPLPHPDHAERAAAAALAMQRAMVEVNAAHEARGLPRFEMGIGLNTGEAVIGNIGSEQRAKYSVVGSAVNLAARVESATVGGQILLTPATLEALRDLAEVTGPVPVQVKGVSEPLGLWDLRGLRGRFAQRLPDAGPEDPGVAVAWPLRCWIVDGKIVREDGFDGEARRAGPLHVDARLPVPVPPLTNVRLRVRYADRGHESGDLWGKVVPLPDGSDPTLTRVRLTAVDPADRKILEALAAR